MMRFVYTLPFSNLTQAAALENPFYLRCTGFGQINEANELLRDNPLFAGVIIQAQEPFSFVPFDEAWQGRDIVLRVPSIGSLRMVLSQLKLIKSLQLRLCVAADTDADLIKILSSSGIWCCVDYAAGAVNWEAMEALRDYAFSSYPVENRIEPFACLLSRYRPETGALVPSAGFERFDLVVHLDGNDGGLELSFGNLGALTTENFLEISRMDAENFLPEVYHDQFRRLTDEACLSCPSFSLCRSAIAPEQRGERACQRFFAKLTDLIEERQARHAVPEVR